MSKYKEEIKLLLRNADRRININAPEDEMIKNICEKIGYGAVMDSVARQWQRKDPIGAFTTGPCRGTLLSLLGVENDHRPN